MERKPHHAAANPRRRHQSRVSSFSTWIPPSTFLLLPSLPALPVELLRLGLQWFSQVFSPSRLSQQQTSRFLCEKRLLPHLPQSLNAPELPSHQRTLFELGVCSCGLDYKTLRMISPDPELSHWLPAPAVRAPVSKHLHVLQVSCSKIFP